MPSSLLQDLQRVRETLELNILLVEDQSRRFFDIIFSPANSSSEPEGCLNLVGDFILKCDSSFLCKTVITDLQFWELLKELLADATADELASYINRILTEILDQPGSHKESLASLCQAVSSDETIMDTLVVNLSTQQLQPRIALRILDCIIGFLTCFKFLSLYSPSDAAHVIPSFLFTCLDTGLWETLTSMLSSHDLRIEIFEKLLPIRRQLFSFLKDVKIDEYETPLKKKLLVTLDHTINTGATRQSKFENSPDFDDFVQMSLLQAFDITAFLENENLTFKKTFTEQLLFCADPFPLFYASLHVCDTLNNLFENIENESGGQIHNLSFVLNKEQFMYALMDRILKSWVEAKGKNVEDLNSLLELIPITFDRISKSLSNSLNLTPQGYFRLALDVIREVDYKLSRELQLDSIREARYEKWSSHVNVFENMLSNQVNDYVHHQRLLQLQKGTWVYADNPIDINIKFPRVYFMVLSANQVNLLVKEFPKISDRTPLIEDNEILASSDTQQNSDKQNTMVIPLSSISTFKSKEILLNDKTPQDSHLVNVIQKNFYTEVELVDKNNKSVLKIFFDTKEAIYSWLDGIQLVSSAKHPNGLSQGTMDQVETLIDIRKSVQMINLAGDDDMKPVDYSQDDEEYYDINTLKGLTRDFYYE